MFPDSRRRTGRKQPPQGAAAGYVRGTGFVSQIDPRQHHQAIGLDRCDSVTKTASFPDSFSVPRPHAPHLPIGPPSGLVFRESPSTAPRFDVRHVPRAALVRASMRSAPRPESSIPPGRSGRAPLPKQTEADPSNLRFIQRLRRSPSLRKSAPEAHRAAHPSVPPPLRHTKPNKATCQNGSATGPDTRNRTKPLARMAVTRGDARRTKQSHLPFWQPPERVPISLGCGRGPARRPPPSSLRRGCRRGTG